MVKCNAAGAAKHRPSLCCPDGSYVFIFCAGPGTASKLHRPEVKGRAFTPMSALTVASAGTRLGSHVRRDFRPSRQVAAVWVWLWCG